jgi:transcriptional regulator with XRE-family HTH domain
VDDTIGERVRRIRRAQDVTQAELAVKSGTSLNSVNRIEKGHMSPSAELVGRIASGLDVPVGELYPQELALPKAKAPAEGTGRRWMIGLGNEPEMGLAPELKQDIDAAFNRLVATLRTAGVGEKAIAEYEAVHQRVLGPEAHA